MRLSTIRARCAVLLVTAFALLASPRVSLAASRGQAAQAGNVLKSRQHFLAGKRAFEGRDYARALAEFEAGYDLEPRPGFLLNMGHAARKMGDLRQAEQLYRRFLATGPVGAERRTAEKLIAQMQMKKGRAPETEPAATASESALAAEPADPPPPAPVVEAVRDEAPPSIAETAPEAMASAAEPEPAPPRARATRGMPATAAVTTGPSLHLSLQPAPPATPAMTAPDPAAASAPAGEPVYRRWWFWTGVGALAVGVAAAVLVGVGSGSSVHDSGSWGQVKL